MYKGDNIKNNAQIDNQNSPIFKRDSDFWEDNLLDWHDFIKFYNVNSFNKDVRKINFDNEEIPIFLKNHAASRFNFVTAVFSLYLSRTDNTRGCIFKTNIKKDSNNFTTLLKVDYIENISFKQHLENIKHAYDNAFEHTNGDIENYISDILSFYSVYDLTDDSENNLGNNDENSVLTLNIHENYLELHYNSDLFSDVYIEHMLANIDSLINYVLEYPDKECRDIQILSDEEKTLISEFIKGEQIDFDAGKTLAAAFRENALNNPDRLAIDDGVNQISYSELEKSSNSIAHDLKNNYGIESGTFVGLMLPRDYHYPELALALNKIGATFIPIDAEYPIKRIEMMFEVSKSQHIITTKELAQKINLNVNVICREDLDSKSDVDLELVNDNELFSLMFTSGTTGRPKGVMISNKQLAGTATAFNNFVNSSDDNYVTGCYASFSFIVSFRLFWALYDGKSCRIFNENERKDSLLLIKLLKENPIHDILLPPSVGIPILENEDLKLEFMIVVGSKLDNLPNKINNTQLINFYGSTEIFSLANICDLNKGDISIGRPLANTWTYILDKNNNQVPIGVPGEICVSTDYLSLGYYENPESTNKVFVENPYCDCEDNKRLYRTGDIGFYNFDGKIEIIGRNDDQLSVRGFRIESDEILGIVNRFDSICDVCLDVDNDNLILYYVASGDLDIDGVKNCLKDQLPYYMIPSSFVELDEIPLNFNGKIDKSALKSISSKDFTLDIDDDVLKAIIDSFKEVLNLDSVLLDDDFVSLGGNSLSAMKLQLSLKEKLDVSLSSNELMELSTPNKICDYVKYNLNSKSTFDEVKYTFDGLVHLSDSQLNIYLDERIGDLGTAYNNSFKIRLDKNYSADEIKSVIGKLFDVFPILSAHIVEKDSEFFFAFDAALEIAEGSVSDIESFVRPFELDKSLSRFMIAEDEEFNVLCVDFHHLIFDGTSVNVFLDKFFAILNGEDVDFVDNGVLRQISFEESITSEYMDDAHRFFDDMFADRDEVNELLPCVDGGDGFEYLDTFGIDAECLNSFLQNHSITHNQFFASVFAYTLSRFTGNPKVLFNLIENGRGHIDLSESVGMFVRTLPLLFDCSDQNVDTFMNYSRGLINSVMKYNFYPFHVLANEYDLNSNILFQYSHGIFKNLDDLNVEELRHDLDCDLSVNIFDFNDSFGVKVLYSDVYSKDFIESLLGSFKLILNEIISVDKLSDINYVSDSDIEILDSYNKTEHPLVYEDVLDAFNDNLSRHPDNKLVSCRNISYSYGEGAFIADKIAESLRDMGVESQDNVAFLVERSELYMFCVLGIMSMGAVYVPLDDAHPDERIKYLIENTDSRVIIASDETYGRAVNLSNDAMVLNISEIIKGDIGCLSSLPVDYGNLACILYTSGTTGLPKGVKLTRKAILNFTEFYVNESKISNDDVYALFASIGFDVAIKGIFSSIYSGACLNVVPEDIKLDMIKLNKYFTDHGVTHTHITTQVAKLFINTNEGNISLKELVTGGEKLGEIDYPDDCRFVDTYGPTEACVYVTSIDEQDKVDSSSVGHLLNNLKAYVLDDNLKRPPKGAAGELYLAGLQIADGYLNRDEETRNAFLNNPFEDNEDYSIMYRTGDLARFLPDGSIDIVGRRDNQVKVRGNRVELSEIESVIRDLDYIDDVTVQAIKNNNDNEVVAYVVVDEELDDEVLYDLISKHVGQQKPDYMIPSFIVSLDEIPLTVNGKVDKRALPEVDVDSLRAEYVAPENEKEKLIVEAFEKVFNKEKIGIYDDFVRLGGDSLTAIKLISHLKGFNISAGNILSLRTPKDIAESVKVDDFDLDVYSIDSGCPLNESQLNVYLDIVANDKIDSYLIPININISKEFSANEICDALDVMLESHPILHMCISDDYDVPYLIKGSKPSISIESEIDSEFLTKPFDLHESLCRFSIVEDNGQCKLYAVFHHIIFDALSERVFKENLESILRGKSVDYDDSFLKVSAFNQQIQNTEEYDEASMFYDSMLVDIDDVGVLLESVESGGPGIEKIDLDFDFNLFKSFLHENGISENVLFTSVFAYTLSRFINGDKALFNIIENGRDRFNNFNSIGMYVNTLPFLVDCKNQDISSFVTNVSDVLYNVMKYNYYPFKELTNKYDIDSSIQFQFMPDWIGHDEKNSNFNDIIDEMDDLISDFGVNVIQNGESYSLNVVYSEKYSKDIVQRFVESYRLILQEIISVNKLSEIDYVSKSELELLDKINQTDSPLLYQDVLDAFNSNLAKYPDNNLVSYNDRVYSYAQGAFIADKIAEKLKDLGVESQDCVAFLTERSEYYMFSILGIMSAGAVYVPLDDAHPDDRLELILEDSQCSVVIVSDETYGRAEDLSADSIILNISDIVNDEIGSLSSLPVVYSDLACILYTSGTTGIPKGVKITRKAINNYANSYVEISDMNSDDVFALYASIGFDVGSVKSICVSIYAGACLNVVPNEIRLNLVELNKHFVDNNVTHANLPTQVAKLFIDEIVHTSLKVLVAGGEKLGEINTPFNYRFIDAYGPTECCVSVSAIDNADKIDSSSVGYLLNNLKAYVLDNELRRVPMGAVGELYIAGYQIADGYLNRDEETQKSFLKNPFDASEDYGVMYRTGDMVRILRDGSLSIVGRRDNQVKIRGNRVELSDVESVIRGISFVDDVTVQTFKNNDNYELVAYVVVNEELEDGNIRNAISSYVGERKPPYMIPSFVIDLDEIPLTVNGKVDKRALPEVDLDSLHVEFVAPTNEKEKEIAHAFELILNQKEVGLFDDFIQLGGDSIAAIRVISVLREKDIFCKPRDILNFKTPYLIAQHVNESVETVSYDAVEGVVDLLPIQKYFFDYINQDNFTQHFVLKLKIDVDINILQEALNQLCNIQDMLRAVYKFDDEGKPIQEILPQNTLKYEINEYDINDLNNEMREILRKSTNSIDIANHLIDVNIVHYKDVSYLTFVIHHLIIDGISWNNLLVDLTYIYFRLLNGKEIELKRPYPYKNWVNDVKNLVENISDEEKQHWIKINNLLDDSSIKGSSNVFAFNVDANYDVDNLLMLSEEEYLSLAIARAYKKTYGEDIIFNRESYGRDDSLADVSRTVGWFTTEYPALVEINNGKDNISLMNDVYNLKKAFKDVTNLGLNYFSLVYITEDLKYKHCPVTFNFLSTEFVFRNSLFDSVNQYLFENEEGYSNTFDSDCYGINFNIACIDNHYVIGGRYANGTYLGNEFQTFIENIKSELEFLSNYRFENEGIVCCLSESQLGVYLDEKVNDKENAYAATSILECGNHSIDEIKNAIHSLVDKHPILKGRILDTGDMPLLICDNDIEIETVNVFDRSSLVKPFNLNESLVNFFIVDNEDERFVFYNIHHIITDATSGSIISNDFESALNDELDDAIDVGFVYASRDSYESKFKEEYRHAKEFFIEEFSDIDDVQYMSGDVGGSVGKVSLPIHGVRNRVERYSGECGITVSNFLTSVFAYAYSRFTGSNKVYFTFNNHGRQESYSKDALSMFVRTIPIIVDCKNKSIKDYVSNVSDLILESMIHAIYSFRLLASEFNLNNNVSFEYNYDLNDVSDVGDDIIFSENADEVSEFSCAVNDLEDGYLVKVNHLDKFSQDTAERFANVFKEVLIQFLDKENLEDINYISNDDVELLDKINKTDSPLLYQDVLDAFNSNLAKYPDNDLVSHNDRVYSYAQGAFIADKIAEKLRDLGVESQDCVAFLTERSEYYMFSVLGIMSAGAVYVPLDDAHPDERLELILNDTRSRVVIVSDETYGRAEDLVHDSIILNISDIVNGEIGRLSSLPVVYGDLACILYTSGTTGVPKGVQITRKAINNYANSYVEISDMNSDDVFALYASIGFDVGSIKSICVPIYAGASLNIVPADKRLNLMELNKHFIENDVTHANLPTQVAKLFINEIDNTSLKILVAGGEKLGEVNSPLDYRFIDAYGPTECCVSVSAIEEADKIDSSSIGYLLNNLKAYILDNEGRRVPKGAVGELYLAGYQVAAGYLNRHEENEKAFLDNPFDSNEEYSRMYRTGDMVRVLPDGSLAIVGRSDGLVKIRGNRVELSEVEAVIREISFVDDVTVQTFKNNDNYELVAYVVVNEELEDINIRNAISSYVGERKPPYMVPSFVIELDEIPLTVNGKVDKRALPEVDLDALSAEYVAPTNEKEKLIVEAFEKVFDKEKISIHDDFVRLGGDSLTAIKLLSYLTDYNVSIADILSLHTPHAIANNINEFSFDLNVYSLESGCPLNESQLNVYLDIKANDKSNAYRIPLLMDIPKEFNIDDINMALNTVFKAHPILGMCVSDEFDIPYLVKGSEPEVLLKSDAADEFILDFLTKEFKLDDSLSRFLIVENENNYSLFAVFHHIIFDDISAGVFKQDLFSALKGKSIDVDVSFLKSSAFCQQIQNTGEFDNANEFFESMLADSEECVDLLDEVAFNQSGIYRTELKLDLNLFKSFLHEHSVSENVLFTSAFAYTLSRFVGNDKVKFNMIENGRDRFNNIDSIGMYVNTLPILINCENQDVSDFIEYSSSLIYNVMKYNYYPFRVIANKFDVDSSILFQFIPNWFDNEESEINKISQYLDDVDAEESITDLNVNIFKKGNDYLLSIVYSEKYSKEIIERFAESYMSILSQIMDVCELSDINYVSESDLKLLDEINQTEHPLKYDDILDAFNSNLAKYPDNNLVSYGDRVYNHAEGAFIADKIAKKLRELGVESQDRVAFLTERSEYYLLSVLGIMSMGAVYVPLDDAHPDERIEFILNDTQSKVIIVSDETFERAKAITDSVIILNISDILKDEISTLSELPVSYGDLACILYTSGTTGIPKGVKITRKSVLNLSEDYCDDYQLSHDDVYGMFSNVGFDAASWGIVLTLYSGACLDIIPNDIRLDINAMNEYFIKHNVTQAFITTQVGKLFADRIEDTSLYLLGVGGEKLGEFESSKNYELVDFYGPTESFVYIASQNNKDKLDSSSIGKLNYNTKAYILDDEFRRIPVGAVGELYVAGYQIAEGYLNRDEETNSAFLNNSFTDDEDYSVMYRTGDLVRLLPDGSLAIVGRSDSQVKIRGNRVELSEVEAVIREMDCVEDVTVQTIKNGDNNELVAYVVPTIETDNLKELICNNVRELKPDYMVPSFVVNIDEIPLNVNGKVDKNALPEVDLDSLRVEYVAPTNDKEKIIVEAFEKVFNQDKISIHDDFIHLGGDSLTAIKLLTYIEGYNLSAGDILSLHTPYEIAKNIKDISLDLDVYSLDSGCPLNEPQLNVYLDIVANNKTDSYFIPLFIKISNDYGVDGVFDALNEMLSVHPILGMCISDGFDVPYLVKGSKPEIIVKSDADEEYVREFLTKPFNLHDSLSRFLIVENENDIKLYSVFHHIVFDALSEGVFRQDLQDLLDGKSLDVDDSFLKVSAYTHQIKESSDFADADKFYESMLADSDEVSTLLDSVGSEGPGSIHFNLDLDINLFNSFIHNSGISENVLFSSVFAYVLSRFAGGDKVLFNIVENGRDRFNNLNAIGMFVNTLPLMVDCKNRDVSEFMEYVSNLIYNVMKYNYYPFRLLANKFDIDSNVIFQFLPDWISEDNSDSSFDLGFSLLNEMEDFISDLSVDVIQKGNDYSLYVIYSDKYSRDFIERFVNSYNLILQDIIKVNELCEINYTLDADLNLLDGYNETEHDLIHGDVLDAFNSNLAKYPDNDLVSYNDRVYSYAEGAFIADKIAEKLRDLGIESQDCVAFLTERSEYYMFSVLGIMSAGAVYVPLDDAHPDERLELMLNDTRSRVVIVSDETYGRAEDLAHDSIILNISDIVNGEIGSLSSLPVVYGDLACILYTSGTTGIPKGVKITRKSILNLSEFYIRKYDLTNTDVYALFASIGFDVAMKAIFPSICAGACLTVVPTEIKLDMNAINDYFIEHGVTHTEITTQVAKLFISQIDHTSLKVLTTGGEKLGDSEIDVNYRFVDSYGPTEACVDVTSIDVNEKIDYSSIGYLLDNIKAYILDDEARRVPAGAVGELYLAGNQIAEGYLNRDEENDKAFLPNPFDADENYGVMYRTGDLVRLLPDGSLAIVGRSDSQVKIRGNRVELSEVEAVIREISFVDDVTVQTFKNNSNYELVAYVVVNEELDDIDLKGAISSYVGERKPPYMVPSFVIELDEIPLTVNGKVDKRALPEVDLNKLRGEYVAPENEVESFFVRCFEEILGIDKVGVTDNFFEMGGDSLLVIKIIVESVNNGYSISYADVFDNPTPRRLSKVILSEKQTVSLIDDGYDYSSINDLLKDSTGAFAKENCVESLGNVLLTGATGFLGIHLLYDLLDNEDGDVYCLIRPTADQTGKDRLKSAWNYYFKRNLSEFENRLHVIEGDITNYDDFDKLKSCEIDTIINSAGNVKHFAEGSELKDINFGGTLNALDFAKSKGARFIQISTESIAGICAKDAHPEEVTLYESDLFIDQIINNKYVESKFLAERAVLQAAADSGLDVKIMRVGNLMARHYDGMFQRNYESNAFVNDLKSFVTLGKMPSSFAEFEVQFSAIDITARSIIALSKTPKNCCVFHPFSNRETTYQKVVNVFNQLGLNIEFTDEESFENSLNNALDDELNQDGLFGLLTHLNISDGKYKAISVNNDYTIKVLSQLGVTWPKITERYLQSFIKYLDGLNFFKK